MWRLQKYSKALSKLNRKRDHISNIQLALEKAVRDASAADSVVDFEKLRQQLKMCAVLSCAVLSCSESVPEALAIKQKLSRNSG